MLHQGKAGMVSKNVNNKCVNTKERKPWKNRKINRKMILKSTPKAICLLSPKSKRLIINLATINTEQLQIQALHHLPWCFWTMESVTSRARCTV